MKKMLKRADGSKSQRGLWDNIRAKAASNKKAGKKGKAPSKAMLEQERKIKKEEDMKSMYKKGGNKKNAMKNTKKEKDSYMLENIELDFEKESMGMGGKMKYKSAGFPDLNKDGETTFADVLKGRGVDMKKSGGKSMEPGGGGRFAAMVSGLKKEGKSEGSAKAIAASIGRKKYGKSRFQEMAAAGKKKMGGKKK
jgi:hypothetical protein